MPARRTRKPALALRKPPSPEALAAFVEGSTGQPGPSTGQPAGRGLVRRADGRVRRRCTVYLPPDVARELELRALDSGRELSELVELAVRAWLRAE